MYTETVYPLSETITYSWFTGYGDRQWITLLRNNYLMVATNLTLDLVGDVTVPKVEVISFGIEPWPMNEERLRKLMDLVRNEKPTWARLQELIAEHADHHDVLRFERQLDN